MLVVTKSFVGKRRETIDRLPGMSGKKSCGHARGNHHGVHTLFRKKEKFLARCNVLRGMVTKR